MHIPVHHHFVPNRQRLPLAAGESENIAGNWPVGTTRCWARCVWKRTTRLCPERIGSSEVLGVSGRGARKPLNVLFTLAPQVQDALAPQEREVALNAGGHGAGAEVPELLAT